MSPGASMDRVSQMRRGIIWPSVIAILFATFAAISFAVDQSVDLTTFPALMIDD